MPKERRDRSVSLDRSKVFPFPCNSSSSHMKESTNPSELAEDIKEWEEARCPVCMEHPHNAVLLLCSSHDKGCHPYMCDTSYRHSNCLDQFRKAFAAVLPSISAESSPNIINFTHSTNQEQHSVPPPMGEGQEILLPCNEQEKPKLSCPLCRGSIKGWIVVEPARQFLNAKTRSCSSELCPFSGSYTDLRKHARMEHPLARPTEVDQNRQRNWRRLERQRDLGDVLSTIQSAFDDDRSSLDDEDSFPVVGDDGGWLTVYFLIRVFRSSDSSWSSVPSRLRGMSRSRRRTTLWGESYDHGESASREDNSNNALEGVSGSWHSEHSRSVTPENDE